MISLRLLLAYSISQKFYAHFVRKISIAFSGTYAKNRLAASLTKAIGSSKGQGERSLCGQKTVAARTSP
jgi:hypothetical protein